MEKVKTNLRVDVDYIIYRLKDILDKNKIETMYSNDSNDYVKVIRTKEVEELLKELQLNEDNHNKKYD
jgi:hypothetical protein